MCEGGNHKLYVILRAGPSYEQRVVRWCEECGAVVVDLDFDGRTHPGGVMKMRVPTKKGLSNDKCR